MNLRQKMFRNSIFILSILAGVGFVGCSSATTEVTNTGSVEFKDSSFSYDETNENISGYAYLRLTKTIVPNQQYSQDIRFTNFLVETACEKKTFSVNPQEISITDNTNQMLNIDIQLSESCDEQTFTLHGEKISTTTFTGEEIQEPVIDIERWSKTFNLQGINEGSNTNYSNIKVQVDRMNLKSLEYLNLSFVDRDNDKKELSSGDVRNVRLTIQNPSMLKFEDNNATTYSYSNDNNRDILLRSNNKAGTALIKVEATVFGKEIENMFSVTILSGPISTMSIVFESSEFIGAFYENTYQVHPVDEYGNKANAGEKIYVGVVNGLRQTDDNATKYLYSNNGGEFSINGEDSVFKTSLPLGEVDVNLDKVVILANSNRMYPDYLGGWSIADKTTNLDLSNGILYLNEQYTGKSSIKTDSLKFLIGNERRYDMCRDSISVADVDMDNNVYEIDDKGNATVKLKYDRYLLGNNVYIYANTMPFTEDPDKITKRVGFAMNELLFGTGITASPLSESFTCNAPEDDNGTMIPAATKYITVPITLENEGNLAKNVIIEASSLGGCTIRGNYAGSNGYSALSNTGCDGAAEFVITIPSTENCECEIIYNGIYKDSSVEHHD